MHVRVRPKFDAWSFEGEIEVDDAVIDETNLNLIFQQAERVGLGDWRPGRQRSLGPYGRFGTKITKIGK